MTHEGVSLRGVTKRFGPTVAADRVDLEVQAGELFFLLGPSGCGKTTLMRLIAGLAQPDAGAIFFGARDVTHEPTSRRGTALVFQSYALWPHMTVAQNVAFGLDVRGVPKAEKAQRVAEALRAVRLDTLADRRPAQLSGGQQQRVALARALIVRPAVLLLDEPLSNLDAALRLEMRGEVRRICTEHRLTAVYVTHDQEEALSIADRIAVMREGQVLQVGTPTELYTRPTTRFVATFLGGTNLIEARVVERTAGVVQLESPLGPIVAASDVSSAETVTCSIRPESIRILGDGATARNTVEARHVRSTYLGHLAEHLFETPGGTRLTVEEHRPRDRNWTHVTARLGFEAQDVVVLRD